MVFSNWSFANYSSELFFDCLDHPDWKETHRILLTIFSGLIIIVGTTGNLIAYFVLKQKAYKNNVMASALRYLAVVDCIILWTVLLRLFFKGLLNTDIALLSSKICLLINFYTFTITSCGNWLLAIITLTRLIHLMCPFRTQTICSKFNYYLLVTVMHLSIFIIHGSVTLGMILQPTDHKHYTHRSCYSLAASEESGHMAYSIVNVTTNFLAPGTLLLVFNVMIAQELKKMEEREKMLKAKPQATLKTMNADASGPGKVSFDVESTSGLTRTTDATQNALEYQLDALTYEPTRKKSLKAGLHEHLQMTDYNGDALSRRCEEKAYQIHTVDDKINSPHFFHLEKDSCCTRTPLPSASGMVGKRPVTLGLCTGSVSNKMMGKKRYRLKTYYALEENISQNANRKEDTDNRSFVSANVDGYPISKNSKSSQSVVSSLMDQKSRRVPKVRVSIDENSGILFPGTVSSATTVKSLTSKSELKLLGRSTWVQALVRASIALNQPVDLDVKSWPSSGVNEREDWKREVGADNSVAGQAAFQKESAQQSDSNCKRDSRVTSLTRLLMIASAAYLCLNAPFWLFHLVLRNRMSSCSTKQLVRHCVLLLRYSNHSLNFFFYCASGSRFRQEFFNWWRNRKPCSDCMRDP